MKNIIPLLALICFLLNFEKYFAQNQFQAGLIIGYNSSTFLGNDKPGKELKSIPGFYLGGIVNYTINERFSLQSNAALSTRGTEINTIGNLYEYVVFFSLDIPVMVKMNLFVDEKISPYLLLGGAFDYNIFSVNANSGILNDIKKVDLGIESGLGLDIGIISLSIRYNYGITKFDDSEFKLDLRNSTLTFLIGIILN
jgi:Outer membrane protein beta-barrel domain